MAGAGFAIPPVRRTGRPYPPDYEAIPYPKGYIAPKLESFSVDGTKLINPDQHLAHFMASCGNTGSNDALLLRQLPQS